MGKGEIHSERCLLHYTRCTTSQRAFGAILRLRALGYIKPTAICYLFDNMNLDRSLSDQDIVHNHSIVISLNETIRLMKEIDDVIEAHGGWPGAFEERMRAEG